MIGFALILGLIVWFFMIGEIMFDQTKLMSKCIGLADDDDDAGLYNNDDIAGRIGVRRGSSLVGVAAARDSNISLPPASWSPASSRRSSHIQSDNSSHKITMVHMESLNSNMDPKELWSN